MGNELGEKEGVELLQKLPIFNKLTFDETAKLGEIARHTEASPGDVVIERGALGDALYVIIEGEVLIARGGDAKDADEELGRLGSGDIFGEMALIDDMLTSARATVVKEAKLLMLARDAFEKLLAENESLALKVYRGFCQTLAERLRRANDELSATQAFSIGMR